MASKNTETDPFVMAIAHKVRRDALDCIARGIDSPVEIANAIGEPLGVVSYHVRMLRDYGVIERYRLEHRRGAVKHYYRITPAAVEGFERGRAMITAAVDAARGIATAPVDALTA